MSLRTFSTLTPITGLDVVGRTLAGLTSVPWQGVAGPVSGLDPIPARDRAGREPAPGSPVII
jgi:hypothetical protein